VQAAAGGGGVAATSALAQRLVALIGEELGLVAAGAAALGRLSDAEEASNSRAAHLAALARAPLA